jgi:hypothetical protein
MTRPANDERGSAYCFWRLVKALIFFGMVFLSLSVSDCTPSWRHTLLIRDLRLEIRYGGSGILKQSIHVSLLL